MLSDLPPGCAHTIRSTDNDRPAHLEFPHGRSETKCRNRGGQRRPPRRSSPDGYCRTESSHQHGQTVPCDLYRLRTNPSQNACHRKEKKCCERMGPCSENG